MSRTSRTERLRRHISETLGIPLDQIPDLPASGLSASSLAAQIAGTKRADPNADVSLLKEQLQKARLEDRIRRLINDSPPLTAEQVDRLMAILKTAQDSP